MSLPLKTTVSRNTVLILATALVIVAGAASFASNASRQANAANDEPTPVTESTQVVVDIDGVAIKTTFGSFLAANKGFDSEEIDGMWDSLQHGERYHIVRKGSMSITLSRAI